MWFDLAFPSVVVKLEGILGRRSRFEGDIFPASVFLWHVVLCAIKFSHCHVRL
jgi:hypothetical protein